jgi:molybdopterin molybdotransferase
VSEATCAAKDALRSIAEAQARVRALTRPISGVDRVPLNEAVGRILARRVRAAVPLPTFDNAAVDGYALASAALAGRRSPIRLPVVDRIAAGEASAPLASTRGAVRIFTGAPVPAGFDAVVMQERCRIEGEHIILDERPMTGLNVRLGGEDVVAGAEILTRGIRLDARHLALAAAVGVSELVVRRRLRAAVLSTGNELRPAGQPLPPATIYDSNRPMIAALLAAAGAEVVDLGGVADDPWSLARVVGEAAATSDVILSTGGISVGDEDHVIRVMTGICSVRERLMMAVKPGKPAAIGRVGDAIWLALPGNAFAAFVAFHILARPMIETLLARADAGAPFGCLATAAFRWQRTTGRDEFFPVRRVGRDADGRPLIEKLGRGGSARLRPLVEGDGLAKVDADVAEVCPGSRLTYMTFAEALSW